MAASSPAAIQRERDRARERMAAFRASPAYPLWLERTREQRKAYKAEQRRKAGAKTLAELKAEAAKRKAEAAAQKRPRLHSAHVSAWRSSRSAEEWRHRYRTDPEFNAKEKLRARLRKLRAADTDLQQHLAEQAKRGRWTKKWCGLLGYSLADLIAHLRRTVPRGYRWEQFLAGDLHIDHITPRARFDLSTEAEVRACWSLGNLRLLPKAANIAKGARMETLL